MFTVFLLAFVFTTVAANATNSTTKQDKVPAWVDPAPVDDKVHSHGDPIHTYLHTIRWMIEEKNYFNAMSFFDEKARICLDVVGDERMGHKLNITIKDFAAYAKAHGHKFKLEFPSVPDVTYFGESDKAVTRGAGVVTVVGLSSQFSYVIDFEHPKYYTDITGWKIVHVDIKRVGGINVML